MLTRYDRILIYLLFFLVLVSFLAVVLVGRSYLGAKEAVVYLRGRETIRASLSQAKRFAVNGCVIEVSRGRVRVASSTCPNKLCVSTGWIGQPSQVIVCAPQRVVVKIEGSLSAEAVDTISR